MVWAGADTHSMNEADVLCLNKIPINNTALGAPQGAKGYTDANGDSPENPEKSTGADTEKRIE